MGLSVAFAPRWSQPNNEVGGAALGWSCFGASDHGPVSFRRVGQSVDLHGLHADEVAKAAAKHRASIAETLATVAPAFASTSRGAPAAPLLRRALYGWAFRAVKDKDNVLRARRRPGRAVPEARRQLGCGQHREP